MARRAQKIDDKPEGLWYGVDASWLDWCVSEGFRSYKLLYGLQLDLSSMLVLTTVDEVKAFAKKYAGALYPGSFVNYIDWAKVAKEFGGIEISPYQWDLRLSDIRWYYGWDVASGCIWDPAVVRGISEVRLIHEAVKTP